ncbi:TPA: ATP-binding protein [Escherichia coli]|nr:ATP-binding protein [Escherichia coli]HAY0391498.1 ATP-binding protein [Escherichia coli]
MFHTIVSIKNDGHYFCRAGGNRPDGLNEPVTQRGSIIVVSQLPVENWYKMIGDSTHADAILDRLVHGSIKIELKGESMRKIQSPLTEGDQ